MERRDGARLTWIGRVARSKVFVGLNAVALPTLLLLAGLRFGPALAAAVRPTQPAISISGPGVSQASASVTAYILGDVAQPGVYTLAVGARVQALVAAAGGALDNADLTRVDLAALVVDGQEIYVPRIGETIPLMLGGKVDINVASASDLHHALGIEVAIANRIVAYRVAHGAFTAISQLLLVPISLSEYNKIKSLVTV
ncbi:MAG TPA: helix-hairpin-helix domain-containing protein [Ktedonobacterales bacterium]|nr:helix-hairpin-helix domain-containing protein [Ktedonobacterales bacterium]